MSPANLSMDMIIPQLPSKGRMYCIKTWPPK